jgi:hypothetical protein
MRTHLVPCQDHSTTAPSCCPHQAARDVCSKPHTHTNTHKWVSGPCYHSMPRIATRALWHLSILTISSKVTSSLENSLRATAVREQVRKQGMHVQREVCLRMHACLSFQRASAQRLREPRFGRHDTCPRREAILHEHACEHTRAWLTHPCMTGYLGRRGDISVRKTQVCGHVGRRAPSMQHKNLFVDCVGEWQPAESVGEDLHHVSVGGTSSQGQLKVLASCAAAT